MSRAQEVFKTPVPTIKNRDGFPAYERPLEEQYLQTLLTNTLGNTYYASGDELLQEAAQVHDAMLAKDPVFAAKALGFARNEGFMRLQPIFGLAKLAGADRALFAKAFPAVIRIPSDLADFLSIMKGQGHGEGGRAVKRQIAAFLNGLSEYHALKYNGRGRGYSLGDMVATAHPRPKDERQKQLFLWLMSKEANLEALPQIAAFEALKRADTDEARIAAIAEGRLPHEIVTGAVKPTKAVWEAILQQMPIFALLRNLNTLGRAGVLDGNRGYITERLTDREALAKSKILPFQFLKGFEAVESGWARDVLRQAVELTFDNLPEIPGKTAIFLDISGSMDGDFLRIASVFALALYKKTKGNAVFWLFDTDVHDPKPSMVDSILTQAERIHAAGGTDTGAPLAVLIRDGIAVDNIIIITDEQQNTGSAFVARLRDYRDRINHAAKAFIIDVAPYREGMIPPTDKLSWYIYGWSDTVLQYISMAAQGFGGMVEEIRNRD